MKKLFTLSLVLFVASCAFPSTKEGMTLTNYKSPQKVGDRIFVKKSKGGSITLPFWTSEISDDDFTAAVKDSLLNSKTFENLSDNWDDNWGLEIEIVGVEQPLFGIDFSVQTIVKYSLYLKNKKVYETNVSTTGIARLDDTLFGVKRLRLANEKSAQSNIKEFINRIEKEKLKNRL